MMRTLFLGVLLLLPVMAVAEVIPPAGQFDSRVRVINYNPLDVVKLTTFYGVSTNVEFGSDESIKDIAVGDDSAWKIVNRGNHLFIKPQAKEADTNVTVVTNKRSYHFALMVNKRSHKDKRAWADGKLIFALKFRYPHEEAEKRRIEAEKKRAEALKAREAHQARLRREAAQRKVEALQAKLSQKTSQQCNNVNYWVRGSYEISPIAAHDDGRFTYLTFAANADMPAVYSVDAEGNEAMINTHVDGSTLVVQRVVKRLTLRKGRYAASVLNQSYSPFSGVGSATGTSSPDVVRVIKGVKP